MANKRVVLRGRGPATLRDADYVAQGGEGTIYRLYDTVVKLYTDPKRARDDGIDRKIALLRALAHEGIGAPTDAVENARGEVVGHYMPWVEGEPLARVFGGDWRARNAYADADAITSVERMREIVVHAHAHRAVLVDANELNWILQFDAGRNQPWVIDVDSWSIDRWRPAVIMPSIRDWTASEFDERSDWFAWGVVAFQVLVGIHPYRGRLDGYRPGELERRMRDRASIFHAGVRLPHSARDLAVVPAPLLAWFESTFEQGRREPPPSATARGAPATMARTAVHRVTTTGNHCAHDLVFQVPVGEVVRTWPCGVARLGRGLLIDMKSANVIPVLNHDAHIVRVDAGHLIADAAHGSDPASITYTTRVHDAVTHDDFACDPTARFWTAGDVIYEIVGDRMSRLSVINPARPMLHREPAPGIMPNSTGFYPGIAVMDVLGSAHVMMATDDGTAQLRVPELDGLRVEDARARGRFATVLTVDRGGRRRRHELWCTARLGGYRYWVGDTDQTALNLAVLARGVVAMILDDGDLTIYVPGSGEVRHVLDRDVTTRIALETWDDRVVYLRDGGVWQLKAN